MKKIEKQDDEALQQWLLPHFPILRPEKFTSALRIVFDASAQCDGSSLNDAIAVGPKLQQGRLQQKNLSTLGLLRRKEWP